MPATKITARGAYLKLTSGASTLTLHGHSNKMGISMTEDAPEVTVFGQTYKERVFDGLKDWEMTFDGYWGGSGTTVDDFFFETFGASVLAELGPSGSTATCVKWAGVGVVQDYTIGWELENAVTLSGTIVALTGSLTKGTM